ncbi:MAG: SDR family oxidoreductase [Acetobacteraceae bacterium]|nr:SDR family oxidoreductase [Acetobacteraceae bacterium]
MLAGKVAIVTGAARGIGAAIAAAYAREGARVALLDLDRGAAEDAIAAAGLPPGNALAVACDVSDPAEAEAAVAQTIVAFGAPDILVNNAAALTPLHRIGDTPRAEWDRTLAVGLTGAFLMSHAVLRAMRPRRSGLIINIASQLGHVGAEGRGAYCVAKSGLLALTRAIALDHAAEGIRCVALSPGAVLTERLTATYGSAEAAEAALLPRHPIGRLARPEELAKAALFLASEGAAFMTGTDLVIDGGYTAR